MDVSQRTTDILRAEIGTFTVNTAVNTVTVASAGTTFFTGNAGTDRTFFRKDNIVIDALWMVLPYCFSCAYTSRIRMLGSWGAGTFSLGLGSSNYVEIPIENVEIKLGVYVDYNDSPTADTDPWGIIGDIAADQPVISMINAPAALNGETLPVYAFIRVYHTLDIMGA